MGMDVGDGGSEDSRGENDLGQVFSYQIVGPQLFCSGFFEWKNHTKPFTRMKNHPLPV